MSKKKDKLVKTETKKKVKVKEVVKAKPKVTLDPPWVTYYKELVNSLGADPLIVVGPLVSEGDDFIVVVTVTGKIKAQAVADIIKDVVEFGGVVVKVIVRDDEGNGYVGQCDPNSDVYLVAHTIRLALQGNPYFRYSVIEPLPFDPNIIAVYPIFTPNVIQFENDDLSNLYQTYSNVASKVFVDVLKQVICAIPILYSNGLPEENNS